MDDRLPFAEGEKFSRSLEIDEIRTDGDPARSQQVKLSFSSEKPVRDFSGPPVVLLHEEGAFDSSRMRSVLLNHNPDVILGKPEGTEIDLRTRRGLTTVVFDQDEQAQLYLSKVRSGSLRGASVSYVAIKAQRINEGENWTSHEGRVFKGPLIVATRWQPVEVSLTPIPADFSVGVGRSKKGRDGMKKKRKPVEEVLDDVVDDVVEEEEDLEDSRQAEPEEAKAAGKRRAAAPVAIPDPEDPTEPADPIEPQAQPASLRALRAIARKSGLSLEQAFAWAEDGLTEAEARSRAFEDWSSRSRLLGLAPYVEERGPDPIDKFQRWALAAFHRRLRLKLDDDAPKDAPQHLSLIDAARELVRMRTGRDQRFVTPNQFLHSRDFAHSTSFFAELLENTARKTLRNGYEMEPTTYQRWTARRDLADFKAVSEVNLGAAKNYTETPELMPIQEQTITDAKEVYTLATYGNRFSISRQAILNDDLAGFARLPRMFGSAAARTINHLVYTHLNANPTMTEDGKALFADDHPSGDNLRPAAAPSVAELGEMRQLMRLQGDLTDPANKLNLTPRFIIAPANYEVECEQALNAVFTFAPTSAANATPLSFRSLELIVESYLDGLSATRWYVVADPNRVECVVVGRLTGQEEPVIQQIVDTEILGVAWVAYFDCVVRAIDHRGLVRNG